VTLLTGISVRGERKNFREEKVGETRKNVSDKEGKNEERCKKKAEPGTKGGRETTRKDQKRHEKQLQEATLLNAREGVKWGVGRGGGGLVWG